MCIAVTMDADRFYDFEFALRAEFQSCFSHMQRWKYSIDACETLLVSMIHLSTIPYLREYVVVLIRASHPILHHMCYNYVTHLYDTWFALSEDHVQVLAFLEDALHSSSRRCLTGTA